METGHSLYFPRVLTMLEKGQVICNYTRAHTNTQHTHKLMLTDALTYAYTRTHAPMCMHTDTNILVVAQGIA